MKRIKDFRNFASIASLGINESSGYSEKSETVDIIKKYISETNNKGGDKNLCSKIADELINKFFKGEPGKALTFFESYGIGSVPMLDVYICVFEKIGFLKDELTYRGNPVNKNLLKNTEDYLQDEKEFAESYMHIKKTKRSSNLSDDELNQILGRVKENLANEKVILEGVEKMDLSIQALLNDDPSLINEKIEEFFLECGGNFISNYQNAAKFKRDSPNIYKYLESKFGEGDTDLASTLGDVGF
jgi:hypothetical protein